MNMTLAEWHQLLKTHPRNLLGLKSGCADVTVITYIYGRADYVEQHFYEIENAIRETWFHFGFMKTVVVTNNVTPSIENFLRNFREWVRVDICHALIGGDLYAYSRDCIKNLHKRFSTPYMLFIHPDGFPLRSGIEDFIGKYDYIGAPWPESKDDRIGKLLLNQKNFVGNGGFSLRSHAICEAVAYWYKRGFKLIPNIFLMYEDYFFTRVLTKYIPSYKRKFKIAPPSEAAKFALEQVDSPKDIPLGFHSASAFMRLQGICAASNLEL